MRKQKQLTQKYVGLWAFKLCIIHTNDGCYESAETLNWSDRCPVLTEVYQDLAQKSC